jgi:sedoheptulokinase
MEQQSVVRVCTAFNGTRINPQLRGSIANLSEDNFTPEALTYGVLEGMVQELYDMYCLICEGTDIKAEALVASGNGLRLNVTLQEICSKKFGAKLTLAEYKEEAACGAAISGTMRQQ